MGSNDAGHDATPKPDAVGQDELASVEIQRDGAHGIIRLVGEFDLHSRDLLTRRIDRLLRPDRVERMDVDASEVEFIDSSGLAALLSLRRTAIALGIDLRITAVSSQIERVLHVAGLTELLPDTTSDGG